MKRLILVGILSLVAIPLWADFGLSNMVTKEIHRSVVPAESTMNTMEQPVPEAQDKVEQPVSYTKTAYYPYTIHISSWQSQQEALLQYKGKRSLLGTVFITKIDLGASGIWYRVDYGVFPTIKDAVERLRELRVQKIISEGAFVGGSVPYSIEVGMYGSEDKALSLYKELEDKGVITYVMKESEGLYRVLAGAYPDTTSASPAYNDLMSLGLTPTIKKR